MREHEQRSYEVKTNAADSRIRFVHNTKYSTDSE